MREEYKRTQMGWAILTVMVGAMLAIGFAYFNKAHGANWVGYMMLAILGVAATLFCSLTVVIQDGQIQLRFGPGLIRKTIALKELKSFKVVKTPWYYGWGIRKIPNGWLFNVSGLTSVELQMKDGMLYRIGTDGPENLAAAIDRAMCHLQAQD